MFATAADQTSWPVFGHEPWQALGVGLILYFLALPCLFLQNRRWAKNRIINKETAISISNIEIAVFFLIYYFVLGAQRPLISVASPIGLTTTLLFSLTLYFGALFTAHYAFDASKPKSSLFSIQLLLPFAVPFLLFVLLGDLEALIPFAAISARFSNANQEVVETVLTLAIDGSAIIAALILMPPFAVSLWRCKPLEESSLTSILDALCRRANFHHGGYRLWNVLPQACTAAIIGIAPRLRYILFTPRLLTLLSPHAIEAVLAHEIGHSKKRHLLFYPFIIGGMGVFGMAVALLFLPLFLTDYPSPPEPISPIQEAYFQLIFFFITIVAIAVYLRLVFGYFSRLFERQADLYVLELGLPVESMVEALDALAIASGNIHNVPNWHHYSIRERIDLLDQAAQNPEIIKEHSGRVRKSMITFSILLALAAVYIVVRIAALG